MGTAAEGLGEELVAMADLLGGVDVEGCAVVGGEGCEVDSVAVEGAVAVGEGAGIKLGCGDFICQNFRCSLSGLGRAPGG